MSSSARPSRTQRQRRDEMRRAVLDATVESLLELGFSRTTTLEVQRRAGISRGALLHHFPSKAELIAAAVRHLADMRGRELRDRAAELPPDGERIDAVIDMLWESFSGPMFYVAMELRTAARTDPEFRDVLMDVELEVRDRINRQSRRLFGAEISERPGYGVALDLTLQLMIGASMTTLLHREHTRVAALIDHWKTVFPTLLDAPCGGGRREEP